MLEQTDGSGLVLSDEINFDKIWLIMMLVVLLRSPKAFEISTVPFNVFFGHIVIVLVRNYQPPDEVLL